MKLFADMQVMRLLWLGVTAVWFAVDILSKQWAVANLKGNPAIDVLPILRWKYAENYGAAFSILTGNRSFLLVVGMAVSIFLLYLLLKTPKKSYFLAFGYATILGGAIGNIYDRFILGYVRDMISVYYVPWDFYFAIFNVADVAINIGVVAIVIDWVFYSKKSS